MTIRPDWSKVRGADPAAERSTLSCVFDIRAVSVLPESCGRVRRKHRHTGDPEQHVPEWARDLYNRVDKIERRLEREMADIKQAMSDLDGYFTELEGQLADLRNHAANSDTDQMKALADQIEQKIQVGVPSPPVLLPTTAAQSAPTRPPPRRPPTPHRPRPTSLTRPRSPPTRTPPRARRPERRPVDRHAAVVRDRCRRQAHLRAEESIRRSDEQLLDLDERMIADADEHATGVRLVGRRGRASSPTARRDRRRQGSGCVPRAAGR